MREILFRGKRIDNGEWVYGLIRRYASKNKWFIETEYGINIEVDFLTIGQFTGFIDKNGKKIFENDIVKSDWGYGELNTKVEFQDIFFADNECTISENIEVIGNISDNPDLLGGSE